MSLTKVSYSVIKNAPVNVKDYGAKGDGVTDDWAAIQAAINSTLDPSATSPYTNKLGTGGVIYFPAGRYRISQSITIPNATTLVGDGRQASLIAPLPAFSGPLLTDKGHAGKIFINDLRVDAAFPTGNLSVADPNYASVTACIELGNNLVQHGQAKLENLYLSGGAVAYCLRVNSNVATYVDIEAGYSPVTFKNNDASSVAAVFERCYSIGSLQNDFVLGLSSSISNSEIEAPASGCIPIYITRKASISNIVLSLSNGSAIATPAFIEMGSGATDISLVGFNLLPGSAGSTLTNMIKDNRVNYPSYWGAAESGYSVSGLVSSSQKNNEILGARRQAFIFSLTNDAGTLKHRITSIPYTSLPSPFADRISGATNTFTATPTGTDATTAFVTGAKISSATPSLIVFNTQSQLGSAISNVASGSVSIVSNSSGTALTAIPNALSIDINGVTRNYYALQFLNATSGAAFNLTTLGSGQTISVVFDGYIY